MKTETIIVIAILLILAVYFDVYWILLGVIPLLFSKSKKVILGGGQKKKRKPNHEPDIFKNMSHGIANEREYKSLYSKIDVEKLDEFLKGNMQITHCLRLDNDFSPILSEELSLDKESIVDKTHAVNWFSASVMVSLLHCLNNAISLADGKPITCLIPGIVSYKRREIMYVIGSMFPNIQFHIYVQDSIGLKNVHAKKSYFELANCNEYLDEEFLVFYMNMSREPDNEKQIRLFHNAFYEWWNVLRPDYSYNVLRLGDIDVISPECNRMFYPMFRSRDEVWCEILPHAGVEYYSIIDLRKKLLHHRSSKRCGEYIGNIRESFDEVKSIVGSARDLLLDDLDNCHDCSFTWIEINKYLDYLGASHSITPSDVWQYMTVSIGGSLLYKTLFQLIDGYTKHSMRFGYKPVPQDSIWNQIKNLDRIKILPEYKIKKLRNRLLIEDKISSLEIEEALKGNKLKNYLNSI